MKSVELLAEIEDVIRSMPPKAPLRHNSPENHSWLGHAIAAIGLWDSVEGTRASNYVDASASVSMRETKRGYHGLMVLLNQARSNLRMQTIGPVNLAIGQGFAFNYFDEMRKIIALAQADILFIDPYLDAEFVSPYLPQVAAGATIRLLPRKGLATLVPAARLFTQQEQRPLNRGLQQPS